MRLKRQVKDKVRELEQLVMQVADSNDSEALSQMDWWFDVQEAKIKALKWVLHEGSF